MSQISETMWKIVSEIAKCLFDTDRFMKLIAVYSSLVLLATGGTTNLQEL